MKTAMDDARRSVSFLNVPIKYIARLAAMTDENIEPHEPIVDRDWYKTSCGYVCVVTFRWLYEGRWQHDEINFEMPER